MWKELEYKVRDRETDLGFQGLEHLLGSYNLIM